MVDTRLLTVIAATVVMGFLALTGFHAVQEGHRTRDFIRNHEIRSLGMAVSAGLYRAADRYHRAGEELLRDGFLRDWILDGERDGEELRTFLENVRSRFDMMDASIVSDRTETYYGTDGRTLVLSRDNLERDGWYYLYRDSNFDSNIDAWYFPETGSVGMWVNVPIRDADGAFLGVTGGGVELEEFAEALHAFGSLPDVHVYLARRDGQLVYATDSQLLKSAANIDSLWDVPLTSLVAGADHGASCVVVDPGGVTGPILHVSFSDTWNTFVVLEKTGGMVRDRMRTTALNSLRSGVRWHESVGQASSRACFSWISTTSRA